MKDFKTFLMTYGQPARDVNENELVLDYFGDIKAIQDAKVLVKNQGNQVGLVGHKEILKALSQKQVPVEQLHFKDVAPAKILYLRPEKTLEEAIQELKTSKLFYGTVENGGRVTHFITLSDLYDQLVNSYKELTDQLYCYIYGPQFKLSGSSNDDHSTDVDASSMAVG